MDRDNGRWPSHPAAVDRGLVREHPRGGQSHPAKKLQTSSSGYPSLRVDFYLSGDSASDWVKTESQQALFGIAFDLLGDGSRVLVASRPATVAAM
jgi:hypothetical protein